MGTTSRVWRFRHFGRGSGGIRRGVFTLFCLHLPAIGSSKCSPQDLCKCFAYSTFISSSCHLVVIDEHFFSFLRTYLKAKFLYIKLVKN